VSTRQDIILANTSVTYRQLDWWCRKGYLQGRYISAHDGSDRDGGTGTRRDFTNEEMQVAIRMARLVDRGFTPSAAARVARASVEAASGYVYLGQGLHLHIHDEGDR
jgi:hypothetical protein